MRDPARRTTRSRLELADVLRRHGEDYIPVTTVISVGSSVAS
ncbi:hypothetical protein [Mesorhizobium sp. BAC0120]